MFNPNPQIRSLPIDGDQHCWIVDNALADPRAWVARAASVRDAFAMEDHNAYPGIELPLPDPITEGLAEFFAQHLRSRLGARRIQRAHSRLSIVTRQPHELQPRQWICHRDRMGLGPEHVVGASVLYLFDDPRLGGTSFWRPRRPAREIDLLVHESGELAPAEFTRKYAIAPGYTRESNAWFEHLVTVPPAFNRLICYDGTLFHCSDIPAPELLSDDPTRGRLTLNGFFHCTRRAGTA